MAIIENFFVSQPTTGSLLNEKDSNIVETYSLSSAFDTLSDRIEIHFYTLTNNLLLSDNNYNLFKNVPNRFTEGTEIDSLEINPANDAKAYGYTTGDIRVVYNFIKQIGIQGLREPEFFIKNISPDRTELIINSTALSDDQIDEVFNQLLKLLSDTSYLEPVVLNFKNNVLSNIVNSQRLPDGIAIKLYNELPPTVQVKDTLVLNLLVSDTISYDVVREVIETPDKPPALKGPNFSVDVENEISNPTEYLTSLELLQKITSSLYEPYSLSSKSGIDPSIDYTDYSNFIHFSSAEERLRNFKYKLEKLTGYQTSRSLAEKIYPISEASSSMDRYDALISGVIKNFDHYDRHLYFESGSTSWPKSNSSKPYINLPTTDPSSVTFFNNTVYSSSLFDENNPHRLINSIPSFLKEDQNNAPYNLFIDMIGQHFDNLWIYTKALGDRYDADNRLDKGISKELVGEALRSFGMKLYSNNTSFENLFSMFVGEFYQTGSEIINTFVTASNQPTSKSDYQKEVFKRLYHNTPLLLKSKGTERGIKALFTSFGIPTDILNIKYTGGVRNDSTPYYGPGRLYTSSLDRIRIDNTGSIVSGSKLSYDVSIIKNKEKYSQDLHTVQIGFSPSDYINEFVISSSLLPFNFDIDNYIGDPRLAYSGSYDLMDRVVNDSIGSNLSRYDLKDLIRLIKFYDNTFFKMVKDYLPARTNVSSGIVIKPTIFNRSKVKQVRTTVSRVDYSGATTTTTIEGSHGRVFRGYNTAFSYFIPLPSGSFGLKQSFNEARFTGELSGSEITVTAGELNEANLFKKVSRNFNNFDFHLRLYTGSLEDKIFNLTLNVTDYPA